jgi:hypothetical protein
VNSRLRIAGIDVGKPAAAPSNADRFRGRGARRKSSGLQANRVSRSEVVLADRFDCRSRRAARGQERPGVKSARKRPRSSHPLSGAGRRKSVGSRVTGGQALAPVAGSRSRAVVSRKGGGGPSGHSSMEGASGRREPQPLNGAAGKGGLGGGRRAERHGVRRDKRCQRSVRTLRPRKTTPRNGGRPFEGSPISELTRVSGTPATAGSAGA